MVLEAYTFLWNKKLTEAIELKQKKRREAEFLEQRKRKSQLSIDNSNSSSSNILEECDALPASSSGADIDPKVVIRAVEGESISDAIGVLLSGIRILLMIVEGDEDLVI